MHYQPISGQRFAGDFLIGRWANLWDFHFGLVAATDETKQREDQSPAFARHRSTTDHLDGDFLNMDRLLLGERFGGKDRVKLGFLEANFQFLTLERRLYVDLRGKQTGWRLGVVGEARG